MSVSPADQKNRRAGNVPVRPTVWPPSHFCFRYRYDPRRPRCPRCFSHGNENAVRTSREKMRYRKSFEGQPSEKKVRSGPDGSRGKHERVAELIGVTRQAVSQWPCGSPGTPAQKKRALTAGLKPSGLNPTESKRSFQFQDRPSVPERVSRPAAKPAHNLSLKRRTRSDGLPSQREHTGRGSSAPACVLGTGTEASVSNLVCTPDWTVPRTVQAAVETDLGGRARGTSNLTPHGWAAGCVSVGLVLAVCGSNGASTTLAVGLRAVDQGFSSPLPRRRKKKVFSLVSKLRKSPGSPVW